MKIYKTKVIAEVGCYITDANGKRGFALPYDKGNTYIERELTKVVEKRPYNSVSISGVFNLQVTDHMKKTLISTIWSNDDQIAIILNKDNGDIETYEFMQAWRKWFSELIHNIEELYDARGTQSPSGE